MISPLHDFCLNKGVVNGDIWFGVVMRIVLQSLFSAIQFLLGVCSNSFEYVVLSILFVAHTPLKTLVIVRVNVRVRVGVSVGVGVSVSVSVSVRVSVRVGV